MPGAKDYNKQIDKEKARNERAKKQKEIADIKAERPSIFERFNILKKIKEALEKGWDALRTATTAVAVRVLGGKDEFSKYVEKHDSLAGAAEALETKNCSVGDKVAVEVGQFHIEGTVLQRSENEQGEFVTVELCDGKVQTFPAEAVETVASFEERNVELPKEYRKTLIDAESYSKYVDVIKQEQELKDKEFNKEEKTFPEEQKKEVDVPEVGKKFVFLETTKVNDLDMVLSGTEMTVVGTSENGKSALMQGPNGRISEVPVDKLQDWRAMPKEVFEMTYQDGNFVVKSCENQQGEMASVYVQKQLEKANTEKETSQEQEKKIDNSEREEAESRFEVSEVLQNKVEDVKQDIDSDLREVDGVQEEKSRFETSEVLQNKVEAVEQDVDSYYFDDEAKRIDDYEASVAYDKAHQPVSLAENRDSLSVGMHFAYAFKGKYQEATVTAINKKSIDIQANDGREFQIKNADKDKAVFGYEEIKADKDVTNRVMDQNSTKFSDMFRAAYEKTEERYALEAEAEELGIDLYGGEFDDLNLDYNDTDDDNSRISLSDQIDKATEEANSRNAANKDVQSRDDGLSLD